MKKYCDKWRKIVKCIKCNKRIFHFDEMYNNGICPHCGYDSKSTICKTNTVIVRDIYIKPWYKLWVGKTIIKTEILNEKKD